MAQTSTQTAARPLAVAPSQTAPAPTTALASFEPANLVEAERFAEKIAMSGLMPDTLRGKSADVLIVMMMGRELGLPPMTALRSVSVFRGKPILSAELQVALVKRSPECEYFRIVETSDFVATYETRRRGEEATRMSFTIEQAMKAGVVKDGSAWASYPAAMLRWRCSAHLAKAVYPDVVLGIYDEHEAEEIEQAERGARSTPAPRVIDAQAVTASAVDAVATVAQASATAPAAPTSAETEPAATPPAPPSFDETVNRYKMDLLAAQTTEQLHAIHAAIRNETKAVKDACSEAYTMARTRVRSAAEQVAQSGQVPGFAD
jgi:hypothetical protein